MTRRRSIRRPRDEVDEVGQQPQAVGAAPLRVELDAEQARRGRPPRRTARRGRSSARTTSSAAVGRARRRTSGRSRSRRRRRCRRTAGASRVRSTWFQPMCGSVGASLEPDRPAGQRRRASSRRPRRCPRTGAAARGRCRGTAGRRASQARIGSDQAAARRGGPSPARRRRRRARRARRRRAAPRASRATVDVGADASSAPGRCSRGCRRRSRRPRSAAAARAHPSDALGRGDAVAARIELARDAQRAAEGLERGLGEVMVVAAGAATGGASRRRSARTTRARARRAGAAAPPTRSPRNGRSMTAYGRPPTSTTAVASDSSIGTALSPKRCDPGAVAERLGERGAEHERDVLDRVVLVDLEVAVGRDGQVEQAVVGERAEQVVVEADPGRRSRVWPAPSRPSVTVMSVSRVVRATVTRRPSRGPISMLAERRGHAGGLRGQRRAAAAIEPVVLVAGRGRSAAGGRRADGRPRTCAARGRVAGAPRRPSAARSGDPKSTSRKFVTDGPTVQPSARERVAQARRARAIDAREVGRRGPSGRAGPRSRRVTDTVDTEPGGRYGLSRAMTSGRAMAKPTRSPARA